MADDEVRKIDEEEENDNESGIVNRLFGFRLPIVLILPLLAIAVAAAVFAVREYPQVLGLSKGAQQAQAEARALLSEIEQIIDLPDDEVPTIATVTDVEKVREQPFFSKAENGDRVLIYSNSRRVILYRPSEKRVIEVGAVNINENAQEGITPQQEGDAQTETEGAPTPSPEPEQMSFIIYNGTTSAGLTAEMQSDIEEAFSNAEIVDRANAVKRDYETTILVDLTGGEKHDLAQQASEALNVQLGALPEGENNPENTDFLVIVGTDRIPAQP